MLKALTKKYKRQFTYSSVLSDELVIIQRGKFRTEVKKGFKEQRMKRLLQSFLSFPFLLNKSVCT